MKYKRKYHTVHCAYTPEGIPFTENDILIWHLAPKWNDDKIINNSKGWWRFKGEWYKHKEEIRDKHGKFLYGRRIMDVTGNGWMKPGYRSVILLDGTEVTLVYDNDDNFIDSWEITNGAFGFNRESSHVCYIGGKHKTRNEPKDTLNELQFVTLQNNIKREINLQSDLLVCGHYHLNPHKDCPSFCTEEKYMLMGIPEPNIYNPNNWDLNKLMKTGKKVKLIS